MLDHVWRRRTCGREVHTEVGLGPSLRGAEPTRFTSLAAARLLRSEHYFDVSSSRRSSTVRVYPTRAGTPCSSRSTNWTRPTVEHASSKFSRRGSPVIAHPDATASSEQAGTLGAWDKAPLRSWTRGVVASRKKPQQGREMLSRGSITRLPRRHRPGDVQGSLPNARTKSSSARRNRILFRDGRERGRGSIARVSDTEISLLSASMTRNSEDRSCGAPTGPWLRGTAFACGVARCCGAVSAAQEGEIPIWPSQRCGPGRLDAVGV